MQKKKNITILAYIPARSGSKRIKNKNIKNFCGKPLIAHSIIKALANKYIDRVVVDTDSLKIANIAKKYNADVPFLRPHNLAQDTSRIVDSVIYTIDRLKNNQRYSPDYILLLQATSPLSSQDDIDRCIKLALKENAESVATVCQAGSLFFNMKTDGTLMLANVKKFKSTNSQELPKGYMPNGNVYIIKTKSLRKEKKFITKRTKGIVSSKLQSVDIDTPEDWAIAEVLYKNKNLLEKSVKKMDYRQNIKVAPTDAKEEAKY